MTELAKLALEDGTVYTGRAFGARGVVVEHMEQQAGAGGDGAEFGLEANQSARGNDVFQTRAAASIGLHVLELALA